MLHRIRHGLRLIPQGPWILASALLLAVVVSPLAIAQSGGTNDGRSLQGGARNPSPNPSQNFTRETGIIADTSTYGTRQSNKSGNGGGAIYGCRSGLGGTEKGNEPCVRANNLVDGRAFEFTSTGRGASEVGTITAANPNAAPLTTNAGGVATGFNADKVDGKDAATIVSDAQAQNRIAAVSADGVLGAKRGAESATRTAAGIYNVTFTADVSACAVSATATTLDAPTIIAAAPQGGATVQVRTRDDTGALDDRAFHLVAIC